MFRGATTIRKQTGGRSCFTRSYKGTAYAGIHICIDVEV